MINNQSYIFFMFSLNGVLIGLLFDFFRIIRKCFKISNFITYIQDILFWILTGISIIFFMYFYSEGTIRLYLFIGMILGFFIYMLIISKYIIKLFVFIIEIMKMVFIKLIELIVRPVKKIVKTLLLPIKIRIKTLLYKKIKINK